MKLEVNAPWLELLEISGYSYDVFVQLGNLLAGENSEDIVAIKQLKKIRHVKELIVRHELIQMMVFFSNSSLLCLIVTETDGRTFSSVQVQIVHFPVISLICTRWDSLCFTKFTRFGNIGRKVGKSLVF